MTEKQICELCGAVGEDTQEWGGWCHDCDNQYCVECDSIECECEL